jgi:hypothetical protein
LHKYIIYILYEGDVSANTTLQYPQRSKIKISKFRGWP